MRQDTISVAGVELTQKYFPRLYRWAKINPEGLEQTLKSLAKASGGKDDDYQSVAVNLESDLAHG